MNILKTITGVIIAVALFDTVKAVLNTGAVDPLTINTAVWSLLIVWAAFLTIMTCIDAWDRHIESRLTNGE